jgi:SAM-dependent methyltransferase
VRPTIVLVTRGWAERWQRSWDRLQADLVSDRELRIRALIDVVDAIVGTAPTVVDLACGPGTVTRRLLDRLPAARSIAVDVDPVLLAIASATFVDDDRVRIVRADLRDPTWVDSLPSPQVDAVLTATALHWLPEDTVLRVYSDIGGVVRRGGVVAHAEEMPLVELPRLGAGLAKVEHKRRTGRPVDGLASWDTWWEEAAADPALQDVVLQRRTVFNASYPTEEFSPPADWHIAALHDAGFAEVGVVWRSGTGAIVAGVR